MQGRCLELEEERRMVKRTRMQNSCLELEELWDQGCREFATIKKKRQEELRKHVVEHLLRVKIDKKC